jgi:hypothetical protein
MFLGSKVRLMRGADNLTAIIGVLRYTKDKFKHQPCLFAAHRRQALLHELQRLKVEGNQRPEGCNSELSERGSLFISDVTLLLKKNYLHAMVAGDFPEEIKLIKYALIMYFFDR